MDELKQLPGFEAYSAGQADRQISRDKATAAEAKDVRFKRLVHTMVSVLLAKNLPHVATVEVQKRYLAMLDLESISLGR